ncbi:MAG: queuosine precursor transporter [Terriglobales bacterium]|jgi:queuosine precursor transporter
MPSNLIHKLTGKDTRLSGFRHFELLVNVFVVVLLISNLVAQKIVPIGPFHLFGREFTFHVSGAQALFPITYIFGDVFTEVYGYKASRRAIWIGFFASVLMALMSTFVVLLPYDPSWPNQKAFEAVFYQLPRAIVASLVAYWCGEFTNSYTMAKMKLWTNGKMLWSRTIGSTVAGQLVDTVVVIVFLFAGKKTLGELGNLIISAYFFKVIYEAAMTPFTYLVVNGLKRAEGIDVFDKGTDFNPFAKEEAESASETA